jgi:hypothetical protein
VFGRLLEILQWWSGSCASTLKRRKIATENWGKGVYGKKLRKKGIIYPLRYIYKKERSWYPTSTWSSFSATAAPHKLLQNRKLAMYSRQAPQELRRIHLATIDWNSTEKLDSRCLYLEAHHVFMASGIINQRPTGINIYWPQILMITTTYTPTLTQ